MKYKIKIIISLLSLFCIIVSVIPVQGTKFAVGPNYINIKDALRGGEPYQEVLYIDNLDNKSHTFKLNVTGDVHGWVTFYDFSNDTEPITSTYIRNNSYSMILCKIFVPGDIANGLYNGSIEVSEKNDKLNTTSQNASQVELILPVRVSINVTGIQNVNLTITEIHIDEVEINYLSQIRVQFKNSGNVLVSPVVNVLITKDGRYIDEIYSSHYSFPDIIPGTIDAYTMDWNTTGKISGNYTANFTILLSNKIIYQKDMNFALYPPGTFTRNGTIKNITYQGVLKKGANLKIISTFLNTGEVDTNAKFLGEVYLDGQLISTLESEEKIVRKFQDKTFESYLTLESDGKYQVIGHFLYEERETSTMELDFTVGGLTLNNFHLIILFGVIFCGIIGGILYLRRNKRNKKIKFAKEKPFTIPNTIPRSMRKAKMANKKKLKFHVPPKNRF